MDEIKDQIIDYLSRRKFLTLATTSTNGVPLTHPVAYVNEGDIVYFSTSGKSRKTKNIQDNSNVAYSVYDDSEHLDEIRSIQMEGNATIVPDGEESKKVLKLLKQKFTSMPDIHSDSDDIIIKITPKICYFSDYTKRLGHRDKVEY